MKKIFGLTLLLIPALLLAQENPIKIISDKKDLNEKKGTPAVSLSEPLYILDGKILPSLVVDPKDSMRWVRPLELIDPSTIEQVTVLKGIAAKEKYGEDGKNGAVEIILRKKESQW